MDQTKKLLQCVAENARMGSSAVEQLLTRTSDGNMRDELMRQRENYQNAQRAAEEKLYAVGAQPEPKGMPARAGMWMGLQMNTLTDRSNAHLADLVIQGATMGVIETTKARNECPDADAEAQGLASGFLTDQQQSIDRMKGFLC